MVEEGGFEPPNPKELIYSQLRLATSLFFQFLNGGDYRARTCDIHLVRVALSQLS